MQECTAKGKWRYLKWGEKDKGRSGYYWKKVYEILIILDYFNILSKKFKMFF